MKNKTNYWKPIDFLNNLLSEYVSNFAKLYRLRFRNWRLKMKIREAKTSTQIDTKKRWIIYEKDYRMKIITTRDIKYNIKKGVLKKGTTFVDLDYFALRVITFQNGKAVVDFNKSELNQTKQ